jgi:hypothetical protein
MKITDKLEEVYELLHDNYSDAYTKGYLQTVIRYMLLKYVPEDRQDEVVKDLDRHIKAIRDRLMEEDH